MIVGGGGVKTLPFCLGTALMYLAWKIVRSLGCYVDNESIPLKIIFISVLKAPSFGTSANPYTKEGLTTPLTRWVASICYLCVGTVYIVLLGSPTGLITLLS